MNSGGDRREDGVVAIDVFWIVADEWGHETIEPENEYRHRRVNVYIQVETFDKTGRPVKISVGIN
ncbi:hypothetical protein HanPSC8_Chr06g0248871 [Helianthus annuus]|nr:hypothetical protein HanPSC8_Chr06g0248871 [Helianthus annuus]